MSIKLDFIVVNWNNKKGLFPCLKAIFNQSKKPGKVIVVDNGSIDGSSEMVEKMFPKVKLIRFHKNLGLCAATNIGFMNTSAEFVAMIEHDAVISRNWSEEVLKAFSKEKDVAVVSPWVLQKTKRGYVDVGLQGTYLPMVNGISAIRANILRDTGQLIYDDDYFAYAQEQEFSARLFNMGYRVKRIKTAVSFHDVDIDLRRKARPKAHFTNFCLIRNTFWNLWTYYSKRNIVIFTLAYFVLFFNYVNPLFFAKSFFAALLGIPKCFKKRHVVKRDDLKHYISIRQNIDFMLKSTKGNIGDFYSKKIITVNKKLWV